MQVPSSTPFEYISNHLQLIGWPAVVLVVWQISRFFTRASTLFEAKMKEFDALTSTVDTIKSNHLTHMEMSLEAIDEGIKGLRDDIRACWIAHRKD